MPDDLPIELLERVVACCDAFESRLDRVEEKMSLSLARPDAEPPASEPVVGSGSASELEQALEEGM